MGLAQRVAAVRRFNRAYTQQIGVLDAAYLASGFTLAEARVLYELAHREHPIARDLTEQLGLDAGYLSRILRGFRRQGLVERSQSPSDRRQNHLSLTVPGEAAFAALDRRSREQIATMLKALPGPQQAHLVDAMQTIERLLAPGPAMQPAFALRPHRPGDIGWVASRHGALYAEAYGFDQRFEALVAEIGANFINRFDAARERAWIAEIAGEPVGSVFVVRQSETVAQLRLLLVEPAARGLGVGRCLVAECVGFAREAGYEKLTLWTQSILTAARHIYAQAGFRLVREEPQRSFGRDLVGENWDLPL
jgi:DNA-binding MarR family transcriptional regulator/GNAT superfamily N-acetyltransferase